MGLKETTRRDLKEKIRKLHSLVLKKKKPPTKENPKSHFHNNKMPDLASIQEKNDLEFLLVTSSK